MPPPKKFLAVKKVIFSQEYLSVRTKQSMAQIYLMSNLLFDAGTWPLVNRSEENIVHPCVMRICRSCYRQTFVDTDMASDLQFLTDSDLTAPASTLRILRLSLFSKIVHKQHYHLLSLLYLGRNRERSYIKSLLNDSRTLCNIGSRFEYARNWDMQRWV